MGNMKKRMAILAASMMVGVMAIGSTMAYFTEKEVVTNKFTLGDLDLGLNENEWDPKDPDNGDDGGDGKNMYPGYTVYKNPTVKNITSPIKGEEPCYARMIVEIQDHNGNLITDQNAIDLIMQTIRYDASYNGSFEAKGSATGLVEGKIPGYSLSDIAAFSTVNPDFKKDTTRSTNNRLVYNYMGDANDGILKIGEQSTLFTNIVIPTDWNQTQLQTIKGFQLKVTVEGIQSKGFATQADAYNALDSEIAAGTIQTIDRTANPDTRS